jgi:hypothetical protein
VILYLDTPKEMICMFFTNVFNPKIVHDQRERDWPCVVFPQAGCICTLVVTVWEQSLLEKLVGKDTGLGEAPYHAPHFKVNETIEHMFIQIVLFNNLTGK